MIIANPLYDTAFKSLASDPDAAKTMIEALLETEVTSIELNPTERLKPVGEDDKRPKLMRMDYLATIKTQDGGTQKVLIEMQKGHGSEMLYQFREYLALAGYSPKPGEETPFPVVTIYFLGFKLKNVAAPCLKVSRQYIDMLKNEVLDTKEKFVELLTHDSFVIQAPRIKIGANPKTKLEKVLSIFEQDNFVDSKEETINYKYPIEEEYHKKMVDILHYIGTDPDERKKLDNETYWERYDYHRIGKFIEQLENKEERLAQKDKALVQKDEMLVQKDEALVQKDEMLVQKDEMLVQKDEMLVQKDEALVQKDKAIAQKDEEIERLKKQIETMKI